jgi:histidinol phosphatase-like PHP family hydrolase
MTINADMHVHTFLSSCARPDALPGNYLALCPDEKIKMICFTDHFWDDTVEGASPWYRLQNLEHVLRLRSLIPPEYNGVRVLYGAETEFIGSRMCGKEGGIVGITPATAVNFDFVLIPPDHFHMKDYTIPASVTDYAEVSLWLIDNFMEAAAVELGVPTGIAHPFEPMGFDKNDTSAILTAISDEEFFRCFTFAAEHDKSIELNHSVLNVRSVGEYIRIFTIACECGCHFHTANDAHTPQSFSDHDKIAQFAESCGITADRFIFG